MGSNYFQELKSLDMRDTDFSDMKARRGNRTEEAYFLSGKCMEGAGDIIIIIS